MDKAVLRAQKALRDLARKAGEPIAAPHPSVYTPAKNARKAARKAAKAARRKNR